MKIEQRTVVSLGYRLTVKENGAEVERDKADSSKPLVFMFGMGQLLPDFEKNIENKVAGDKFDFVVAAENGYGLSDERNLVHLPKDSFRDQDGKMDETILKVGNMIPMMDNEGNQFTGVIKDISDDKVLMDFNHPLADKDLHFVGEIYEVRLATLDELSHGHVHGPGGHHH